MIHKNPIQSLLNLWGMKEFLWLDSNIFVTLQSNNSNSTDWPENLMITWYYTTLLRITILRHLLNHCYDSKIKIMPKTSNIKTSNTKHSNCDHFVVIMQMMKSLAITTITQIRFLNIKDFVCPLFVSCSLFVLFSLLHFLAFFSLDSGDKKVPNFNKKNKKEHRCMCYASREVILVLFVKGLCNNIYNMAFFPFYFLN